MRATGPTPGPVRPSVPPAIWGAAGLWAVSAAVADACWAAHAVGRTPWGAWVGAGSLMAAAAVLGRLRARWARAATLVFACAAVGAATALLHGTWLLAQAGAAEGAGPREWAGVVTADPREGATGTRVTVALRDGPAAGAFSLRWPEGAPLPRYGERVVFSTRLKAGEPADAYAREGFLRGEAGSGSPWRVAVDGWEPGPLGWAGALRDRCVAALESEGRGGRVAASAVFGKRDAAEEEAYRSVGAAHLLTASGIHLALAVAIACALARATGASRRGSALAGLGAAAAFCVIGACACRSCGPRLSRAARCSGRCATVAARGWRPARARSPS